MMKGHPSLFWSVTYTQHSCPTERKLLSQFGHSSECRFGHLRRRQGASLALQNLNLSSWNIRAKAQRRRGLRRSQCIAMNSRPICPLARTPRSYAHKIHNQSDVVSERLSGTTGGSEQWIGVCEGGTLGSCQTERLLNMSFCGTASRAGRGYSRPRSCLLQLLWLVFLLWSSPLSPLRSNMKLILCLFLGARASGDCGDCVHVCAHVGVCLCARVPAEAATAVSKAALFWCWLL